MPRCCSCAPRKKLPPRITTATWTPLRRTSAIWRATRWTTSGSRPTCPPPNISPPSLSNTRPYCGRIAADDDSPLTSAISLLHAPGIRAPSEAVTHDGTPILPHRLPGMGQSVRRVGHRRGCLRPFGVFRSHFIQELPRNRQEARFLTRQEALLHSTDREREPMRLPFSSHDAGTASKNSPPCPAVGAT